MTGLTDSRSENVHVAMMNLLWPRDGLEVQDFYDYWVGAHTQISSRLPGIHQYFQHQLDPRGGGLLPPIEGTNQAFSPDERFYGDAEITFVSAEQLGRFAAALHPLMDDEQNVFRKTISYQAPADGTVTLLDESQDDSPNGDLAPHQKFMLYLRRSHEVTTEGFSAGVLEEVAPLLAAAPEVVKVRVRLPEPYDNEAVTLLAPNVSNWEDADRQYQACVEVMFRDAVARETFTRSQSWTQVVSLLASLSRTVHVQQVLRTFTVYNHGAITTAGLRTPQMATQIARLGAVNQVGPEVRQLILGEHVAHGQASTSTAGGGAG